MKTHEHEPWETALVLGKGKNEKWHKERLETEQSIKTVLGFSSSWGSAAFLGSVLGSN